MKRLPLIVCALVLASLVLSACGPAAAGGACGGGHMAGLPDLGGQAITVAVENAYPPFNSIDETTGKGVGWDYDTVCEICNRVNCVPEFSQAAWDGLFPAMTAGEYDMAADGITYTEERDQTVDFSIPYVTVGQVLLVRSAETKLLADFQADASLTIGTQIQTTNYIVAEETFPDREIVAFEDFGAAVLALIAGDVDAVVIDNVSAVGYIGANPTDIKIGDQITSDEQLAFVFPPGSDLIEAVDAALQSMIDDGKLEELNKQWKLVK